jgi:hypothetical protein
MPVSLRNKSVWMGILFLFIVGAGIFFSYRVFYKYHTHLPQGCDEFGYLFMAKALWAGNLFEDHCRRPFAPELIEFLRKSSFSFKSYQHIISPHAYHLDSKTFKIINQYPPGTSLLLSLAPLPYRQVMFVPFCWILFTLVLLGAFYLESSFSWKMSALWIGFYILIFTFFEPFKIEFQRVNSLAPTFGALIASGFLLNRRPALSLILLGFTCLFRITNLVFFIPFFCFYHGKIQEQLKGFGGLFVRFVKGAGLFLAGGIGFYFVYVFFLLGNPFASTYAYSDQKWTGDLSTLSLNLLFYLKGPWFLVNVLLLTGFGICVFKWKSGLREWAYAFILSLYNYAFCLSHDIRNPYYPYASTMIVFGMLMRFIDDRVDKKARFWSLCFFCLPLLFLAGPCFLSPTLNARKSFNQDCQIYKNCFEKYDVVWAFERSGTIEYATGKAAFRYFWRKTDLRKEIAVWLYQKGYKQALWIDDIKRPMSEVEKELKKWKISYQVIENPVFGKVVEF